MGSTFDGLSLFDSGPHRFSLGRVGRYLRYPFTAGSFASQITVETVREVVIVQRGRLVGATPGAVWAQWDAIRTLAEQPRTGPLVDHDGVVWTNMTMLEVRHADRMDRGRAVSLGYEITYIRLV